MLGSRDIAEDRLAHLGAVRRADGRPTEAEPLLREALALAEQEHADSPVHLANRLNELGVLCKDLARYDEARGLYERALSMLDTPPGAHDREVATLYHNLGGIEHARGDYEAAEVFARHGLDVRRAAKSPSHEIAADLVALAAILDGRGEHEEAERMYLDALEILGRDPSHRALDMAVALNDLGASYAKRGWLTRAARTLRSALTLKRAVLRVGHPDIAVTLNNLAWVAERKGDNRTAATLYREADAVLTAALGDAHPKTIACRRNAERCASA